MQKQQAQDESSTAPASGAPTTPRVSGEVATGSLTPLEAETETPLPASSTHPAMPDEAGPLAPSDTLLSAGKPADRLELRLEDGFSQIEARLRDIDARLALLEQKKPSAAPEPRRFSPWLWLAFLVALVIVFQMLQRVR